MIRFLIKACIQRFLHPYLLQRQRTLGYMHATWIYFSHISCILVHGCGYSRATTAIFFALVLIIVPLYIFPRTERTPWKGQNLSSHDFRGGVTEIPIFLTNFIQLSKVL